MDIDTEEHFVEHTEVIDLLNSISKKWAFQMERGTESGRRHYQGRMSLNDKMRLTELKAEMPARYHLSKTSNANKGNRFYVMKDETRELGPWRDTPKYRQAMPAQWVGILERPRPFQQQIMNTIGQLSARKINVIYDDAGNSGKSTFANRLEFEGKCYQICPGKNTNEMCADLCDELEAAMDDKPGLIFVDMERASDQDHMGAIFCALERIKGGIVRDRRYKLRKVFFQSPPMWVYMNQLPKALNLSKDRWVFWEMLPDKSLAQITKQRYKELKIREAERLAAGEDSDGPFADTDDEA